MKTAPEVLSDKVSRAALQSMLEAMLADDEKNKIDTLSDFLGTLEATPKIKLPSAAEPVKKRRGRPPKAKPEDIGAPLSPAEIEAFRAQDAKNTPNQDEVITRAVREVVVPAAGNASADGFRHIRVNLSRHGQRVPTSGHKWIGAIRAAGVAVDEKIFSCIVGPLNGVPKGQIELIF